MVKVFSGSNRMLICMGTLSSTPCKIKEVEISKSTITSTYSWIESTLLWKWDLRNQLNVLVVSKDLFLNGTRPYFLTTVWKINRQMYRRFLWILKNVLNCLLLICYRKVNLLKLFLKLALKKANFIWAESIYPFLSL